MTTELQKWARGRWHLKGCVSGGIALMDNFLHRPDVISKSEGQAIGEIVHMLKFILKNWDDNQAKTRREVVRRGKSG